MDAKTIEDITHQKRAKEALHESEERYRLALDAANDGLWDWHLPSGCAYFSPRYYTMLGYEPDELPAGFETWRSLVHPEDLPGAMAQIRETLAARSKSYETEFRLRTKTGGWRWIRSRGRVVQRGENNGALRMVGTHGDITESKEAQEAVRLNQERLQIAQAAGKIGSFEYNLDGSTIWGTKQAFTIFGLTGGDSELPLVLVKKLIPEWADIERFTGLIINEDKDYALEFAVHPADGGERRIVSLLAKPVLDNLGRPVKLTGVIQDITDRKRAETERDRLFNLSEDMMCVAELDGIFRQLNPAWERTLGWAREEMCSRPWLDFVHPDDQKATIAAKSESEQGRMMFLFENRCLCKDGSWRRLSWKCHLFPEEQLFFGVLRDVTEKKLAEEALRDSERRYRRLIEQAPEGIYILALDGRFLMANNKACEMLGYAQDEILHLNVLDTYPGALRKEGQQRLASLASGACIRYERPMLRKDGSLVMVAASTSRLLDGNQQSFISDITERKLAEDELHRYKEHLEELVAEKTRELREQAKRTNTILQTVAEGIVTTNEDGRIESMNPAAEMILACREIEAIGRPITSFMTEASQHGLEASLWRRLRNGEARDADPLYKIMARRQDGIIFPLEFSVNKYMLGEERHYTGVLRDITERNRVERELRMAKEAAEMANRAKSVFLTNMSHEIRTPMNAILGFSQLLLRNSDLTEEQRRNLDIINHSGEHLLGLINGVLEMSKIEAGHQTLHPNTFDLPELIRDLKAMFQMRTEAKGLLFTVDVSGDLPIYVEADEGKLRQICINLLSNAVKFTVQGGIIWRLRVEYAVNGQLLLISEVEDTGPGISKKERGRIFNSFEQTGTGISSGEGTGLGLAISREFVKMMGGEITVDSELGRGSIFRFRVELPKGDKRDIKARSTARKVFGLAPEQAPVMVLIADDNAENRSLLLSLLRTVGFRTIEAHDGKEALALFETYHPDLVLMDMRMPEMDGYEAVRRIKATPQGGQVPIIAVTASAFEEGRREIMRLGIDGYIRKPFQIDEVLEAIKTCLSVRYIYEEEPPVKTAEPERNLAVLAAIDLKVLGHSLLEEMLSATINADLDLLLARIEQASTADPKTARRLRNLAIGFRYDELMHLLGDSIALTEQGADPA